MIGLTPSVRDLYLPAELGDPRLAPPSEAELVDLVNDRLCICEGNSSPETCTTEARIVHARYRPSVASAATYAVRDIHGLEHFVTYKAHLGDRAENRVVGGRYAEKVSAACAPLRPYALLPERMASLWVFPADPELRGAVRVLDTERTAAWIEGLGAVSPWTVRPHGTMVSLKRYEHSRRAIYRVRIGLDGDPGESYGREFGLRILPGECAAQSAIWRSQLAGQPLPIPRLVGHDPINGWILEEWMAGTSADSHDYSVMDHAMVSAASLHGAPIASGSHAGTKRRLAPMDLLNGIPGIQRVPDWLWRPLEVPANGWIHGDLHPDRVLLRGEGAALLGVDGLRPGAPEEDIASWAADALAQGGAGEVDEVIEELVGLYREAGGGEVERERLRALIAIELMERAASAIRDLQADALLRAARLVSMVTSVRTPGH
ncbi:phosphotransferase [Planctomycetes bacterium Poly30]